MRLAMATLADFANVREGMLNVVSAGIRSIGRENYPSPLNVYLAMLLEIYDDDAIDEVLIEVVLNPREQGGDDQVEQGVQIQVQRNEGERVGANLPFAVPLEVLSLARPGKYDLSISIAGLPKEHIEFQAELWEQ